tara:strand:+ start:37 stop:444 length:408 start_codon:yes stop_codon:yes gene_type:complete
MELVNKNAHYVDYEVDVAGDDNRAVIFRLTYIINKSRFYAIVTDTKTDWIGEISPIPDETAKFMLGADTYYELKGKGITRQMTNDLLDKATELGYRACGKSWPSDFDGAHHVNKEQERLDNFNKNNPTNNLQDLM